MKRAGSFTEQSKVAADKPLPLTPQLHLDLPKGATVHLRPALRITDKQVIERVVISPRPRTPSPYGNRMGDHTVAWQVHLDAIRAELHGLTLGEAVDWMRIRHDEAVVWMGQADSTQMKLFTWLDDHEQRAPLLEDSAQRAIEAVSAARTHLDAGMNDLAVTALCTAIAQHLAYLNYLPYATVRSPSARGSVGSGEGRQRRLVVEYERACLKAELEARARAEAARERAKQAQRTGGAVPMETERKPEFPARPELKDPLWRLFSFDAALRETGLVHLLDPGAAKRVRDDYDTLSGHSESLLRLLRGTGSTATDSDTIASQADAIAERYKAVSTSEDLFGAAIAIRNAAADVMKMSQDPPGVRKKEATRQQGIIGGYLGRALLAVQAAEALAANAGPRVAAIMAFLMHEHQSLACVAYPRSVVAAGLLGPSPRQAARDRLVAEVTALHPKADLTAKPFTDMLALFDTEYGGLAGLPDTNRSNEWVADADNDPLVVTWTQGRPLDVNGRAPAPGGVAGMGSHTTSWIIQCKAVSRMLVTAPNEGAAFATLDEAVAKELASDVMRLDTLLPLAQLQAGQLHALFDAAVETLTAETVSEAATGYLCFRNLLPYATVDAGNRAGQGERGDGTLTETFDTKSLEDAATLQARELTQERETYVKALPLIAASLEETLREDEGEHPWNKSDVVRKAVAACAKRLRAFARTLRTAVPKDVAQRIQEVRSKEHGRLHALSQQK
ncbi:hypothetical protein [Bailinhaonella thermotolerans]|uniref:Uncharacterized protein n=1 Tax=Bailinhaonella thermotolerans TaxID=1070861 RepID=A0A3A4AU97_9ACTN|nr:hypothetical protein [Bailinhaonella thermotolerans]RJL33135.1 hypothetical protein D5H75_09790 [Bailinhaonella thermotolerans]